MSSQQSQFSVKRLFVVLAIVAGVWLLASLLGFNPLRYWVLRRDRVGPYHSKVGTRIPDVTLAELFLAQDPPATPDKKFPEFPEMHKLSTWKGKIVVMNLWGTWCHPCRHELPILVDMFQKNFPQGDQSSVVFVALATGGSLEKDADMQELRRETQAFLAQEKLSLTNYADPSGNARRQLSEAMGFSSYPTTIVLDGNRTVLGIWEGYYAGMENDVRALIKKNL